MILCFTLNFPVTQLIFNEVGFLWGRSLTLGLNECFLGQYRWLTQAASSRYSLSKIVSVVISESFQSSFDSLFNLLFLFTQLWKLSVFCLFLFSFFFILFLTTKIECERCRVCLLDVKESFQSLRNQRLCLKRKYDILQLLESSAGL